jgi:hypothetical protein
MKGNATYHSVLVLRGWWTWVAVAGPSRLTDAGAPLALVLLGHATTGSFTVGGIMSGAYALTAAIAAPWSGARLATRAAHRAGHGALAGALLARAGLFATLAALAPALPTAVLIGVTAVAGGVGAGSTGTLRALLSQLADGPALHRALSLDTVLLELAWTASPAGVALLATHDARLACGALAASTAVAGAACCRLAAPASGTPSSVRPLRFRALRPAARSLLLGLLGGLTGGVLDTAVPPRLVDLGARATVAGVLFAGYSIASVVGGLAYGRRGWPGSARLQATVLLAAQAMILLVAALVPDVVVLAVGVVVAGACAAPQLTARSLAVKEDLPDMMAAGFSSLEAVNGVGYGLAGLLVGALLPAGAMLAFAAPLLAILAGTLVTAPLTRSDVLPP